MIVGKVAGPIGAQADQVVSFAVDTWSEDTACAHWVPSSKTYRKYDGVMVRYSSAAYPTTITDGNLFYEGPGTPDLDLSYQNKVLGYYEKKSDFVRGTTYYFTCFTYYLANGIKVYNKAFFSQDSWIPVQTTGGSKSFSWTQTWTVPLGVRSVNVFLVGGGGGGGGATGGGGGGGSTKTKTVPVVPLTPILVTVGPACSAGSNGYPSSFGDLCKAEGGSKGIQGINAGAHGGSGGSGGGGGGNRYDTSGGIAYYFGGRRGGSNGNPGQSKEYYWANQGDPGSGQNSTTKAWGIDPDPSSTSGCYSGGGGGGSSLGSAASGGAGGGGQGADSGQWASAGGANTGGGGGGGGNYGSAARPGASGGSGLVLIKY